MIDLKEADKKVLTNAALWGHFISGTWKNIKKEKTNYCLGFGACFMVVFIVALVVSAVSKSPLIFLRLSELQRGETDIFIQPGSWTGSDGLNFTKIVSILPENVQSICAPRRMDRAITWTSKDCLEMSPSNTPEKAQEWMYLPTSPSEDCAPNCFDTHCGFYQQAFSVTFLAIDTKLEEKMGLGRTWPYPPVPPGSCYINSQLATQMNVEVGDYLYLKVNIDISNLTDYNEIMLSLKIDAIYPQPYGKHPADQTSWIVVEYNQFMNVTADQLPDAIYPNKKAIRGIDVYQHAHAVHINIPDRIDKYMSSNYEDIQQNVINFASPVFFELGWMRILTQLPVLEGLSQTRVISLFLGLIMNLIITILLSLSVLLIYSLLMINVDTKTFELGVRRMIGSQKKSIVMMLLIQAFFYSIPAWFVGIAGAQIAGFGITWGIDFLVGIVVSPVLTFSAIVWSSAIGLIIPVAASILPIQKALGMNLYDSLDTRASKTSAVKIELTRADPTHNISRNDILCGLALSIFGSGIYYILPLSLLSMNLGLLLNVFIFILASLLIGLVVLALNLQQATEKYKNIQQISSNLISKSFYSKIRLFEDFLYFCPNCVRLLQFVFFFWEKKSIRSILAKNLIAHVERNRKTAIMYSLSLGFIIFISVAALIQIQTIEYAKQTSTGAYIKVYAYASGSLNSHVSILENWAKNNPDVSGFAWFSFPLCHILPSCHETRVMAKGRYSVHNSIAIYGVSPQIFKTTIPGFLRPEDSGKYSPESMAEALYYPENIGGALVSALYHDPAFMNLNIGDDFFMGVRRTKGAEAIIDSTTFTDTSYDIYYRRLKVTGLINSAPAFRFSPFPLVQNQHVLVSFPTLLNLTEGLYTSIKDLPLQSFLVRVDNPTPEILAQMKSDLRLQIDPIKSTIYNYDEDVQPLQVPKQALQAIFSFTTLIAMAISFFSLMSSMYTNIHEQTKEIAILRALGISKPAMYRIYIYEAFILVFASSLVGILIGMVVSYTMTIQQTLFTQLPIPFQFPWFIFVTVFGASLLFAFLAAFSPIHKMMNLSVVQIFRYVD